MNRENLPELTLRGCLIAAFLTVILTASNVYFGLKSGFTFATSIPAAIISMSVLRFFKKSNILENCTVQTFASSAGVLTSIIFVLPALVMLGYWMDFHYWQTALLCAVGGSLGVLFTVPLRRTLIVESDLPYPEGVAAAKILELGDSQNSKKDDLDAVSSKDIWHGTILSVLFPLFSSGFGLLAGAFSYFANIGGMIFGFSIQYSPAFLGGGYLIGVRSGLAILLGSLISWGIIVPYLSSLETIDSTLPLMNVAYRFWSTKARFVGVGAMATASVWALFSLLPALFRGIKSSMRDFVIQKNNKNGLPRIERDIPINYVVIISLLLIIPIFLLFNNFISSANLDLPITTKLVLSLCCALLVFILGFLVSTVCGYMAGIIGSSITPISGISILSILLSALLLVYFFNNFVPGYLIENSGKSLMALGIFIGSFSVAIASISNDNLQDLKTGQIVGATPWRQQLALIFGVIVGAMVIPLAINLMYQAYGFIGSEMPRVGMDPKSALAAPQANMMTALIKNIVLKSAEWNLMMVGMIISLVFIAIDIAIFKTLKWHRLPVLAVAVGMYTPIDVNMTIVLGTIINYLVKSGLQRKYGDKQDDIMHKEQKAVSFASGFILGETMLGIVFAAIIVITNNSHPLNLVGDSFMPITSIAGFIVFVAICRRLYSYSK
jgi:putative OPT family oligopeptide transporter